MVKKLFVEVFEKAVKETGKNSKNGLSVFLSEQITQDFGYSINKKTITRYYEKYIEGSEEIRSDPKLDLQHALAKYLGYKDYSDFVKNVDFIKDVDEVETEKEVTIFEKVGEKKNEKEEEIIKPKGTNFRKLIPFGGAFLCIALVVYFLIQPKNSGCMIWVEDHYEKTLCGENYNPRIIPLDNKLLKNCKKVALDTSMVFFKEGKPLYWYAKVNRQIEFFTCQNLHRNSKEKLTPISETIIRKYVYKE